MSKEYVLGAPGAVPKLEDVVRVVKGAKCELDQSAASRIKKESPQPSAFKPEAEPPQPNASTGSISLTPEQGRAAVFALLLTLVNGKTRIRLKVVQELLELLNGKLKASQAAEATDAGVMTQLASLITAGSGGEPLPISAEERAVLTTGHSATAGVAAFAIVAAKRLQQLASVNATLTAETIQADVRDFDVERIETVCSGEALEVAAELRGLLNESTRVNVRKGGAGAVPCVSQVPSVHGELDVVTRRAEQLVNALLKSAPSDPALARRLGPAIGLPHSLWQLTSLLNEAAQLSLARTSLIGKTLKDASWLEERVAASNAAQSPASDTTETFQGALAAWEAAVRLQNVLALEATAALVSLTEQGVAVKKASAGSQGSTETKPKKGKGAAGASLGVGTERLYALLNEKASVSKAASGVSSLSIKDDSGSEASGRTPTDAQALLEFFDPWSENLGLELQQLQQHAQSRAKLRKPKVAKGARDFMPDQMAIRELAFSTIAAVFERHGAVSIDTPVFELKETLTGKYGEDSKLIYDLKDQGGELLSLRYDLTVPFARYVALYGITSIKRYHIAKVYRRDQPQMTRGRYREFYQCDFDVAGNSPLMVADSEVLKVLTEILSELDLGSFVVKINHRRLLDGMMSLCGVPQEKFRTICSAIDKLDKEPWSAVRAEMVEEKGLDPAAADRIGEFVVNKGAPKELLKQLQAPGHAFAEHPACSAALQELAVLFDLLDMMGGLQHLSFDLSLARGLDYYTGVIYEAVLEGAGVGSIAAGGRYDNLVGMFSNKPVPAVGVSLGIERIFSILEQKFRAAAAESGGQISETKTQVLVMSASKDMQPERMRLASELWSQGIAAEFTYKANPFMPEQMSYATNAGIPIGVVLRPDELKQGKVEVMETQSGKKEEVGRDEVVAVIQARLKELGPRQLVIAGRSEAAPSS